MAGTANAPYVVASGEPFSNPITAGRALADAAVVLGAAPNIGRSILFEISNKTDKELTLIYFHMHRGTIKAPTTVDPHKSAGGHAKTQLSVNGIKGIMIYKWGHSIKENICLFLDNSAPGVNKSGIKHYWDTSKGGHWYYYDMTTTMGNQEMSGTINNCVTLKSYISGGIHAGAAFVLEP